MVAKPYIIAGVLGVAALVGTRNSGLADSTGSCDATCANRYSKDVHNCPLLRGDGGAYFECIVKAQEALTTCDGTCPMAGPSTSADAVKSQ
jgi:hypothetical protein